MKTHRIAVIAGDGIGPEVIDEGVKVLDAAAARDGSFRFAFERFPWGCEYYLKTGRMMPDDALETLRGLWSKMMGLRFCNCLPALFSGLGDAFPG